MLTFWVPHRVATLLKINLLSRLKLTLLGLKRLQSSPTRKYAVSVKMLKAVIAEQRGPTWDQTMLALALSMAFFFLLRASEYVAKDGKVHIEKILLADDLSVYRKGVHIPISQVDQADELVINLRGSKTDIYNEGNKLNIKLTPGVEPPEHPLILLRLAYAMKPAAFQGGHPLFTKDDNKTVISRSEVNKALKLAALKLGLDPDDHTTHSLRAGGATALWRAGWPPAKIKRRGRWLSDCWLIYYIWPGREEADGIVEDVLALN